MKRFRFTLQALLVLRQRHEQQAMEAYAATLLARRQAAERLARIEEEMASAAKSLRSRISGTTLAGDLAQLQGHYRALDGRRAEAACALEAAEQTLRPALQRMIEARRQREVVDDCRDKQSARHEKERLRQEDKLQDEFALRRFAPALVWRGND